MKRKPSPKKPEAPDAALAAEVRRVNAILAKWNAGEPVPKDDRKLLQKHGRIPMEGEDGPVRSQTAMAEYLTRKFNRSVHKVQVGYWLKGKHLPTGAQPMPQPNADGWWTEPEKVSAWFDKWVVKPGMTDDELSEIGGGNPKKDKERYEAEIKRMERDRMKRSEDANYILVSKSLEFCRSAHTVASGLVTSAIESRIPSALMELADMKALDEATRGRIAASMRLECERINGELQGEIAEKMKR